MTKKIAKDAFLLILTRYGVIPFSIVTGILLARTLGPEELGKYALMMWLPGILAGPMSLGLGNANLYYASHNRLLSKSLFANSIIISLICSLILLLLIYFVSSYFSTHLPLSLTPIFIVVPLIDLPFRLMKNFILNLINAIEENKAYRNIEIAQTISYFIACCVTIFIFEMKLWGFIISQITATILTCCICIFYASRYKMISFLINKELLKKSIAYGMKLQIGSTIRIAGQQIDELIVIKFANSASLGCLTVARNLSNRLREIPYSLATVITPEFGRKGQEASGLAVTTARRLMMLMLIIVSIGILLAIPAVPIIYGKAYMNSVLPLQILMMALIPLSLQRIVSFYLMANGVTIASMNASLINFIVIIILDIALIPFLGITGAALAILLANIIETFYYLVFFKKSTTENLISFFIPTKDDFTAFVNITYLLKKK